MADINGLPAKPFPEGYSFQWVRVDGNKERDIFRATSRTYTPVAADVGKRLKVEVTFKDRGRFGGTRETLASDAVGPVLAVDPTPPVPASAVVPNSGASLFLMFNEDLDIGEFGPFPPTDAFTVKADGVEVAVQSVVGSDLKTIALNLPTGAIGENQIVTVSYAVPATNPIRDAAENKASAFTDFPVTNNSTVANTTAPVPESAVVAESGNSLILTFNEDLDSGGGLPPVDAFTVKADGVMLTVQFVAALGALDSLLLSLPTGVTIGQNQIVTVSYAVPATGPIQDADSNETVAFTDFPVTNNSNVDNTTPPFPASAMVPASGDRLTLVFNKDLDLASDRLPAPSAFTVKANGDEVAVDSVALGAGTDSVILNLPDDAIGQGLTVTVSYDRDRAGTNPIRDTDSREAAAFNDVPVANHSTVEQPNNAPVFRSGMREFDLAENKPKGTTIGRVTATDADRDTLIYSLTETMQSSWFTIGGRTGQLRSNRDDLFDFESVSTNPVVVQVVARDARGGTARVDVKVRIRDVKEPPLAPAPPGVRAARNDATVLRVTWGAPDNAGRPDIERYDLRYRESGNTGWTRYGGTLDGSARSATIENLTQGTQYDLQVRATNADGDGAWSPSGQGAPELVTTLEGDLRLVVDNEETLSTNGEGRLEILLQGQFGTVCEDRFDSMNFTIYGSDDPENPTPDKVVANVAPVLACQLMGYATGEMLKGDVKENLGITPYPDLEPDESGYVPIWLDDVRCAEDHLRDGRPVVEGERVPLDRRCWHAGVGLNNCKHGEDVHLRCSGTYVGTETDSEESAPLTAEFLNVPQSHDGSPLQFEVAFSQDVTAITADLVDHAFEITGGHTLGIIEVDGRQDLWTVFIDVTTTGTITIELEGNRACEETGAICAEDGTQLSETVSVEIVGSQQQEITTPLTAVFTDVPGTHDGTTPFKFQVDFSADIENTAEDLRNAFDVTGGAVTGAAKVDDRDDLWEIEITPEGDSNIIIALKMNLTCGTPGAVCTGDGRRIETSPLESVTANMEPNFQEQNEPPPDLTAQFVDMPAEHDGESWFEFELKFSEAFKLGYRTLRDRAFTVRNGRVTRAYRIDNKHHERNGLEANQRWKIRMRPHSATQDVSIDHSAIVPIKTII